VSDCGGDEGAQRLRAPAGASQRHGLGWRGDSLAGDAGRGPVLGVRAGTGGSSETRERISLLHTHRIRMPIVSSCLPPPPRACVGEMESVCDEAA